MPRGKGYRNRRRRRAPEGRMQIYGKAARQVWRDVKSVKRLINVEFKFFDNILFTTVTTTPQIQPLSNITQGDAASQRDGNQVKCLSIQLSYYWSMNDNARTTAIRVMLVKDKQTNQAQFTASDLLSFTDPIDNLVSPYNRDNRRRFTVLHDRKILLNTSGQQQHIFGKKFRQDQHLRYDANVGDITDLTQASYSLLIVSSELTNVPTLNLIARLNYVDN